MDRRAFLFATAACSVVTASSTQLARAQPAGRFAQALAYSAQRNGAGVLVARHGIVLREDYSGGHADLRHPIGAGARMFAPLLAGSLVEDRLMSLDEPVALTLGDWGAHPVKSTISIRALLSGASGITFGRSRDRTLAAALTLEPVEPPGVRFHGDEAPYLLFTEIARRKLLAAGGESDPARWLTTRTLLPIGCVPIGWARGADGAPRFDDGAAVSARGWAMAGELLRREGVWRAQQLVDENVLREAVRGSFAEARAGFGVWLAAPSRNHEALDVESDLWSGRSPAPPSLVMAAGQAGQRLYISPTEGLVIVRLSRNGEGAGQWSDAQFLSAIYRDL